MTEKGGVFKQVHEEKYYYNEKMELKKKYQNLPQPKASHAKTGTLRRLRAVLVFINRYMASTSIQKNVEIKK